MNTGVPQIPRGSGKPGDAGEAVTFRAVLTPNRSLSPGGFLVLMSAIALVSFVVGVVFMMLGAWPVMGFFGLDVALIYWAFRANYRAARMFEVVEISPRTLIVTRSSTSGRTERFDFQTYWVRVLLDEEPSGHTRLRLGSHGREFAFADFLGHDERRQLAGVLENEIRAALRVAGGLNQPDGSARLR